MEWVDRFGFTMVALFVTVIAVLTALTVIRGGDQAPPPTTTTVATAPSDDRRVALGVYTTGVALRRSTAPTGGNGAIMRR
jgi:hypothetical protein